MPDPNEPISLGLNRPPPPETIPSTDNLQFERAERLGDARTCVLCQRETGLTYYQVQGQTTCESCAKGVSAGMRAPPVSLLIPAALYGLGAAALGCAIYSGVVILFHIQLALIAILVGYMVGKAVRHGSKGHGGRPQQILAVVLTYFAVSTSYVVVAIQQIATKQVSKPVVAKSTINPGASAQGQGAAALPKPQARVTAGRVIVTLLYVAAAAPFLMVGQDFGSVITLLIIFFALQRAWRLTARHELNVAGPYQAG